MPTTPERQKILDLVGATVMEFVRDATIGELDQLLKGELKSEASKATHERISKLPAHSRELLRQVAMEYVDKCLNNFLWLLEGGEGLEVTMRTEDGDYVDVSDLSDGLSVDMHDWIERFSKYSRTL